MTAVRHILITGASSGIGAGLARSYAQAGMTLSLSGRNADRLGKVADDCRQLGAEVVTEVIDVTDRDAMDIWITSRDASLPLDIVYANAGISAGTGRLGESRKQAEQILDVNFLGVVHTIHPVIPLMRKRGQGQLVIMSSLAGFTGLPGAPAYAASKAAVRIYGEGLRGHLKRYGVCVSVVSTGFIRTPMTARNPYHMPMMQDLDRAVAIIRRGVDKGKGRIAFPSFMYFGTVLSASLPWWLQQRWLNALPTGYQGWFGRKANGHNGARNADGEPIVEGFPVKPTKES